MQKVSIITSLRLARLRAGKAPIIIRIVVGGQVAKTMKTNITVSPKHWDTENRVVTKNDPNYLVCNNKLQRMIITLQGEISKYTLEGDGLTKDKARQIVEDRMPSRDFYKFCNEWIRQKYSKLETLRTYQSEITKLQKFRKEMAFGDINYQFLTAYKKHMAEKLKNSDNTIWKSFKFMNTMIRDAIKVKGIIDRNPFEDFSRGSCKNPDRLGIDLEQCNKIEAIMIDYRVAAMYRKVATKFLLMCYSGLRFNDAMNFDPSIHVIGNDHIYMKTQKAGVMLNMKLYGRLSRIIELEKVNPMRKITNQEFNRYLKQVAAIIGIEDVKLTCHIGRHTFGGLLAEMEIPQEQAQRLLAHKDICSARVYYHVKAKNLDQAMDKMNCL